MTTSPEAPLQAWTETVETLLVGTARRALAPVAPSAPWAEALPAAGDPAEALADRCAVLGVYEQAGRALSRGPAEPTVPFQGEERPASEKATVWLRQVLRSGGGEFLFEWLTCAVQRGVHCPPELLPRLLTTVRARSDLGLAQLAAEVAGPRGQWLAAGREPWRGFWKATDAVTDEQLVAQFETASTREREAAFRALRERDPSAARERLRADFAKEPADLRAAFVDQLQAGLSLADEAFLEACLDDRSKRVREVAADLLARLPDAAFGARMASRAAAMLRLGLHGDSQVHVLELDLLEQVDDAMQRDGLKAEKRAQYGPKAALAADIVAGTPLAFWPKTTGLAPAALLEAAAGGSWHLPFLDGWVRAMLRQRAPEWVAVLVSHVLAQKSSDVRHHLLQLAEGLRMLPAAEARALRLATLQRNDSEEALNLVRGNALEFLDLELSIAALEALRRRFAAAGRTDRAAAEVPRLLRYWLSLALDPAVSEQLHEGWGAPITPDHPLAAVLHEVGERLRQRQSLRAAFEWAGGEPS